MSENEQTELIRLLVHTIETYRIKHKLSPEQLYEVISKYNICDFVQNNYASLHLCNKKAIIKKLEEHIGECDAKGE